MRRKSKPDFDKLITMDGWYMGDLSYRAMLDYIAPKCFVEASSTGQHGNVLQIIRNKFGIPVCVKVDGYECCDYISVDRIDFFEPWDTYASSLNDYSGDNSYPDDDDEDGSDDND